MNASAEILGENILTVWHQSAKHAGLPMVSILFSHIIHLAWQAGGY